MYLNCKAQEECNVMWFTLFITKIWIKGIDHQRTILSLVHKHVIVIFFYIIYDRNSTNFRATRRIQFEISLFTSLDLIKRTCLDSYQLILK